MAMRTGMRHGFGMGMGCVGTAAVWVWGVWVQLRYGYQVRVAGTGRGHLRVAAANVLQDGVHLLDEHSVPNPLRHCLIHPAQSRILALLTAQPVTPLGHYAATRNSKIQMAALESFFGRERSLVSGGQECGARLRELEFRILN